MARLSDADELLAAWRALSGGTGTSGWRTIAVASGATSRLVAGRRLPGNEEAILARLDGPLTVPAGQLPSAAGFSVEPAELGDDRSHWLALVRQPGAGLDLFTLMCVDVIGLVEKPQGGSPSDAQSLLTRIGAWQRFMSRVPTGVLSREAELGLHGELIILERLLDLGLHAPGALQTWTGPQHGLHDFTFGSGALEVKTSLSAKGLEARISSLDQLDMSLVMPLHLACVGMRTDPHGKTLGDRVAGLRSRVAAFEACRPLMETRLLQAGWLDARAHHYTRRLEVDQLKVFEVDAAFPKLTRASVPTGVVDVRYTIDIAQVTAAAITLDAALTAQQVL